MLIDARKRRSRAVIVVSKKDFDKIQPRQSLDPLVFRCEGREMKSLLAECSAQESNRAEQSD